MRVQQALGTLTLCAKEKLQIWLHKKDCEYFGINECIGILFYCAPHINTEENDLFLRDRYLASL